MRRHFFFGFWVAAALLLGRGEVAAQSADGVLLREIAPCQVLMDGLTLPGAEHEQPCKEPGLNELLIRKFSDQTYGVSLSYTDYSRSWARLAECAFTGLGTRQGGAIAITPIKENSKAIEKDACQILIKPASPLGPRNVAYDIEIGASCDAICSHPGEINFVSVESRKEKPFSPSFDCRKASSLTEKSICLDWDLSALDFKFAALWSQKYETRDDVPTEARATQAKWLSNRNTCRSDVACIRTAYQQRIKELCNALSRKIDKNGYCPI